MKDKLVIEAEGQTIETMENIADGVRMAIDDLNEKLTNAAIRGLKVDIEFLEMADFTVHIHGVYHHELLNAKIYKQL